MGQCVNKLFQRKQATYATKGLQTQDKLIIHSFKKKQDFQTNSN
jgi:hypothetical protein